MNVAAPVELDGIISFFGLAGVGITAFAETDATQQVMEQCRESRHLADVRFHVEAGGMDAAMKTYAETQSPHIIIIETHLDGTELMSALDALADVCEADTRLILLGSANDVLLYRELMRRGVSEYIPTPATVRQIIRAIADLEEQPGGLPKGRLFAFTGSCGGCGSSTMAASVAWAIGHRKRSPVTLVDLDVEFGALGLTHGVNPMRGVADALRAGTRLDGQLMEGLMQEYDEFLRILPTVEPTLEETDFSDGAVDQLITIARAAAPYVILDVPSLRTSIARRAVLSAEQVFLTATPELSSLRNTKKLLETIRRSRPEESDPLLILNKVGATKRVEVPVSEFVGALNIKKYAVVNYDPATVVDAANHGKNLMNTDRGPALLADVNAMIGELVGAPVAARKGLFVNLTKRLRGVKLLRK